ncbi:hypothetical protein LAWI1_G002200 [Lachnellula willkommii]|uniref:Uncharacterized protein n=1 Tax=Lachnellula willkommii TaxID=215461 RepID=A0A559ME85_9HELO|nr:hypothetical protein LAWI1_G002200 [Lachnellula willkommii]
MRWNRYSRNRRYWLSALAVLFLAVMVIGIVFVAHQYYHDMGGQGFLKTRRLGSPADVCLPLRKIEIRDGRDESLSVSSAGYNRRSGEDVPFYACGDQQNSCEAFGQPEICCPVKTACYPTTVDISPSRIFCCNSALNPSECLVSIHSPPVCVAGTTECSRETGGGCCPKDTTCSPNGCIQISGPYIISSSAVAIGASPNPGAGGTDATTPVTKTVTERPAATATVVKDGEVAQSGVGKDSVSFGFLYAMAWMLVCAAAVVRLL